MFAIRSTLRSPLAKAMRRFNNSLSPIYQAIALLRSKASSPAGIFTPGLGYLQVPGNLLTWSNTLPDASWVVGSTATKSGNDILLPAVNDNCKHAASIAAGPTSGAMLLSGSGTCSIYFWNATDGFVGISQISLTSTPTIYATSYTTTAANSSFYVGRRAGDTATSVTFGGGGLFSGTYTASQIAAMGGIPWTMATASVALSLGPNQITNGSFYGSTGWTVGSEWSVSGGSASAVGTGVFSNFDGSGSASVTSAVYAVSADVNALSGGALRVLYGGSAFDTTITTTGRKTLYLTAANTTGVPRFQVGNGVSATIDNVAVQQLISTPCPVYTDAHAYIAGANGAAVSGLQSNNYTLSDGSTGYAAVDGLDGLVLDGMGTVSTVVAIGTTSVGSFGSGSSISGLGVNIAVVQGRAYQFTYTITACAGQLSAGIGVGNGIATSVNATGTFSNTLFAASTGTVFVGLWARGGTLASATGSVTVTEVTGIHATASGAARPVLRRGAYNQLLNSVLAGGTSGTLGSGGTAPTSWTAAGGTGALAYSGSAVQFTATAQRPFLNQLLTLPVATHALSATVVAVGSGSNTLLSLLFASLGTGTVGAAQYYQNGVAVAASVVPVAGDKIAYVFTVATAGTFNLQFGLGVQSAATGDITLSQPQLETGSIASAYSPTTTAAASNPNAGAYWDEFAGAQSLLTGNMGFTNAVTITVALRLTAIGAIQGFFCEAAGGFQLYVLASGSLVLDKNGGAVMVSTAAGALVANTPYILTARLSAGTAVLRINAAQVATNATALVGTATTGAQIGAGFGGANPCTGQIGMVIPINGALTDAECLVQERLAASNFPNAPVF